MERRERVRLRPVGGAAVSEPWPAAIHLLAELLVQRRDVLQLDLILSAAFSDGGMRWRSWTPASASRRTRVDRLNARLGHSDPLDRCRPTRGSGLFVVARLATRGGFLGLRQRMDASGVAQVVVPRSP
jgi:hypothetical protein